MMDERRCVRCGKQLEQRANEPPNKWRRRRYCSLRCSGLAKTQQNLRHYQPTGDWDARDLADDDLISGAKEERRVNQ